MTAPAPTADLKPDLEPMLSEGEGCPVAALGRGIGALWPRLDELDGLKLEEERRARHNRERPGHGKPAYADEAWLNADDRQDALRAALSCHRAESFAGCLCQLAQAHSEAEALWDAIPEKATDWQVRRAHRALHRLLYSVAAHLEREAGLTVAEAGMGPILPRSLDPWRRAEVVLAELRAQEPERGVDAQEGARAA